MKEYYSLLGLTLKEVEQNLLKENIEYNITTISGKKDKEKLVIPRVIKIFKAENKLELTVTYFSDSLK